MSTRNRGVVLARRSVWTGCAERGVSGDTGEVGELTDSIAVMDSLGGDELAELILCWLLVPVAMCV